MSELIPLVEKAMVNYSLSARAEASGKGGGDGGGGGGVVQPLRQAIPIKERDGFLFTMPVYSSVDGVLATKLVTLFPHNKDVPTHNGTIVLMSAESGSVLAFMDAEVITEKRTAAASAVATKYLAKDSSPSSPLKLGVVGSGVQARSHVHALRNIRSFSEIKVWSPSESNLKSFVDYFRSSDADAVTKGVAANGVVKAVGSAAEAVADADVIVTATLAKEPVVFKRFVKPGAHINAVGAPRPDQRELDGDLVKSSRVFVDSKIGALKEAGDIIMSGAEDRIVAEVGEVAAAAGQVAAGQLIDDCGGADKTETTIFKNLGMAIQDAVAAKLVYERFMKLQN